MSWRIDISWPMTLRIWWSFYWRWFCITQPIYLLFLMMVNTLSNDTEQVSLIVVALLVSGIVVVISTYLIISFFVCRAVIKRRFDGRALVVHTLQPTVGTARLLWWRSLWRYLVFVIIWRAIIAAITAWGPITAVLERGTEPGILAGIIGGWYAATDPVGWEAYLHTWIVDVVTQVVVSLFVCNRMLHLRFYDLWIRLVRPDA